VFDSRQEKEIFLFFKISPPAVGPILPFIHVVQGLFPGAKRLGFEDDLSHPCCAEG